MKVLEKRVKLFFTNEIVRVSNITPEIYRITTTYVDGYKFSYYRSFLNEDDVRRYCMVRCKHLEYCAECTYEFIEKIDF